jgi:hypothetical protein
MWIPSKCFGFLMLAMAMPALAQNLEPVVELGNFLKSQPAPQSGVFSFTSENDDDDGDEFITHDAILSWNTEGQTFSLNLLSNENAKKTFAIFEFSLKQGFRYTEGTKPAEKSGALDTFYSKLWGGDGKFDLAKAFSVKREAVMEDGDLLFYRYKLEPKGTVKNLPVKNIEVQMYPGLKKIKLLRFFVAKKAYIWAEEPKVEE